MKKKGIISMGTLVGFSFLILSDGKIEPISPVKFAVGRDFIPIEQDHLPESSNQAGPPQITWTIAASTSGSGNNAV